MDTLRIIRPEGKPGVTAALCERLAADGRLALEACAAAYIPPRPRAMPPVAP